MVDTFYEKTGELMVRHSDYEHLTAANKNLGKQLQDVETALNSETAKRLTMSAEVSSLKRDDEVHWKTRRNHLRTIDAWKRINKDARAKLRAVVCGYFNDTGAEPSVSVLGRAADEAREFLQSTRSDSPNYKNTASGRREPCPDLGTDGHNHPANPCPKCEGSGFIDPADSRQNPTD